MSADLVRWVIGLAVIAHGVGHVLFLPLLNEPLRLGATGTSWLLSGVLGDGPGRVAASLLAGFVVIGFLVAGLGVIAETTWWRPLAIAASVGSIALIVVMWGGILASPAWAALGFDVIVLVALVVARWPSTATIGT
jgi:hypothetical protein